MRPIALALTVLSALGCAEAREPVADQATSARLTLHLDSARVERSGDWHALRCEARWENDTGAPLEGGTCCSGATFDGLSVVVRDERGNEVARQSYLAHQSPYAERVPFTLPTGTTRQELVFPFFEPLPEGPFEIQLEGGLIGNADHHSGYASESRRAH